jgi:hypothetical protein
MVELTHERDVNTPRQISLHLDREKSTPHRQASAAERDSRACAA